MVSGHGRPQSKGEFPLPTRRFDKLPEFNQANEWGLVRLCCIALNSYFGVSGEYCVSEVHRKALGALAEIVRMLREIHQCDQKFPETSCVKFMDTKTIDYRGEEVRTAKAFSWKNLAPAIPNEAGTIPLESLCTGGVAHYVLNFETYLRPAQEMEYTKPPRVMVPPEAWPDVCRGLLQAGICTLVAERDVFAIGGKPVLNGLFAVSKEEYVDGIEVCRLIMNLVPSNKLCRAYGGEVHTLPSWSNMNALVLGEDEVLLTSSEDVRCFFYLFAVPRAWHRFLCFNRPCPPEVIPEMDRGETHYLASQVLPMGLVNSVRVAQHVHRNVARWAMSGGRNLLGGETEIRFQSCRQLFQNIFRQL